MPIRITPHALLPLPLRRSGRSDRIVGHENRKRHTQVVRQPPANFGLDPCGFHSRCATACRRGWPLAEWLCLAEKARKLRPLATAPMRRTVETLSLTPLRCFQGLAKRKNRFPVGGEIVMLFTPLLVLTVPP